MATAIWTQDELGADVSAGFDDLFYAPGPLLSNVSPVHAVTAISAVIMSALAIIGLALRPTGRVLRTVSWVSLGVLLVFLLNGLVVFLHGD